MAVTVSSIPACASAPHRANPAVATPYESIRVLSEPPDFPYIEVARFTYEADSQLGGYTMAELRATTTFRVRAAALGAYAIVLQKPRARSGASLDPEHVDDHPVFHAVAIVKR